ncbi:D-2-hydroxyacid dehydrogenase [Natrinema sp. 1APR25-10V2]|uniref:D-2-hydroxyacid dehydrogenase n=1 Tax=Natrinema sp. 1APR25-10V2 TaxID=2951081 RepID=UPI0028740A26|nr:D-2-hydroxyacid dehydrogenase [Natrinema sp. 1APR25-10V2]MDS0476939.1 D-2-hydroxyacid dehydrogenase [Natrinema sp. 1APR25-10V2]
MESYAAELRTRLSEWEVRYARTPSEERRLVTDAQIATGIGIDEALLDRATNLELFATVYAGTDHLPMDRLAERGVRVTNASGVHAPGIAEQILGNILVFTRRLHEGWRRKQNREWRHFQGHELTDSTVTIIGLGSIGKAFVQRLDGMEVETIGVRYTPAKGGPTDEVIGFDEREFHDALARTDYLVVSCPLTETTSGLIDAEAFATLPPHVVLVNVARGEIVDTEDLTAALRNGSIRGAALDVTDPEPLPQDHPLWSLENCLITPHIGGYTPKHWSRLADIVAHNADRLDSDSDLQNLVLQP